MVIDVDTFCTQGRQVRPSLYFQSIRPRPTFLSLYLLIYKNGKYSNLRVKLPAVNLSGRRCYQNRVVVADYRQKVIQYHGTDLFPNVSITGTPFTPDRKNHPRYRGQLLCCRSHQLLIAFEQPDVN